MFLDSPQFEGAPTLVSPRSERKKTGSPTTAEWEDRIDRVISSNTALAMVFQPIADINLGTVAGYEALARFSEDDDHAPDQWFRSSADESLLARLDAKVARLALERRSEIPSGRFITINVEPSSFGSRPLDDVLLGSANLDGVVIEITEHQKIQDHDKVLRSLARYKKQGALIALDDTGAGYAGLSQILRLRPSILKLDRELVVGVDRDEARASLVEMVRVFANRIGAKVLAEGVETQSEATALRRLDIPFGQGYFFGRPSYGFAKLEAKAIAACSRFPAPSKRSQLDKLVEINPCVSQASSADYDQIFEAQKDLERLIVLDARHRPCGVLERGATTAEVLPAPLTVNRFDSIAEVARRMLTRNDSERFAPVVCVNSSGRYLGTISAARIFSELADGYQCVRPPIR